MYVFSYDIPLNRIRTIYDHFKSQRASYGFNLFKWSPAWRKPSTELLLLVYLLINIPYSYTQQTNDNKISSTLGESELETESYKSRFVSKACLIYDSDKIRSLYY